MSKFKKMMREFTDEEAELLWSRVRPDLEANGIRSKRALKKRMFKAIYGYASQVDMDEDNFTPLVTAFYATYIDDVLLRGKTYRIEDFPISERGE
ncbi:hypothetical protein JY98_15425 [Exiguobacterium mexicanum]|nr:hypothetical protein JY98_15425 [Exiguobacterium mexicanum]